MKWLCIYLLFGQRQSFLRTLCRMARTQSTEQQSHWPNSEFRRAACHRFGSRWKRVPSCSLPCLLGSSSQVRETVAGSMPPNASYCLIQWGNCVCVHFSLQEYLTVRGEKDIEVNPFPLYLPAFNSCCPAQCRKHLVSSQSRQSLSLVKMTNATESITQVEVPNNFWYPLSVYSCNIHIRLATVDLKTGIQFKLEVLNVVF